MSKTKPIFLILFVIVTLFFLNAPVDFPVGTIVSINSGESLHSVSLMLKENNIIRSRVMFEAFIILYGGEKHIKVADYFFENKLTVYEIARRIERGDRHLAPIKVTIPEGYNTKDIASTFGLKLNSFNQRDFLIKAKDMEGRLFPDTYFFFSDDDEDKVLKSMQENFEKKISPIRKDIILSGKTEQEILNMASIIEGEAKGENDRAFISGILWKRISLGMPLQVDVAPETYKTKGLPKNAVGNPGIKAILATLHPQKSNYLYYLHDKDGNVHYAKNFIEHRANIQKYLVK